MGADTAGTSLSRIALIPSRYLPHLGGVEELTHHLAKTLTAAGDQVEVWAPGVAVTDRSEVEVLDGVTVRRFSFMLPSAHPSSIATCLRAGASTLLALRRGIRSFHPEVLHVQCFGPNGAYATALSWMSGVPLMVTLQGETMMDDQDIFDVSITLRMALRLGLRRASAVTACSAFTLADAEQRFGLQRSRGEVIFNGVVVDQQMPDGRPPRLSLSCRRYVLGLGRLVEKKGFDLLIRAFALIADRHPGIDLVIGGSGPADTTLQELVEELRLSGRVQFIGRLSRDDVAVAMAHAELFVMPSRLEPFGIVLLEAWRAGKATVATSRGGPAEYVTHGHDTLLVDPLQVELLAEVMHEALNDSDLRRKLGSAARRRVADFDWAVIAEKYQRCYTDIAGCTQRLKGSKASRHILPRSSR